MAVTKTLPRQIVDDAIACGLSLFGENRVQEAEEKYLGLTESVELHLIGHLQRNKARAASGLFRCVQSIDKLETAQALEARLADLIGSYVQWAPITLVTHGLEGLVIALIFRLRPSYPIVVILAGIAGVAVMVGGYLAGGILLTGIGPALAEAPGNVVQSAAGVIVGIPLSIAVRRAYPPVRRFAW